MNTRSQLLCLWSGPLMLVLFWLGFMQLAARLDAFKLGMLVTMAGFALMVPWAAGIAGRLRCTEGSVPVLTYAQLGSAAIGSLIGQGATWIFQVAAYRLSDTPPTTVRAFHDLAWFTFLAPWPSFTVWCVALALAIFGDRRAPPDFPRWAAYLSLWTGWFKAGPFSWNGVMPSTYRCSSSSSGWWA